MAAYGVEGTEDNDLLVLLTLEHGFQTSTQCQCRLSGASGATHRDNSHTGVEEHVDSQALFCRAAVQAKEVAVTANKGDLTLVDDATEGRAAVRVDDQPGVDGGVFDL